jgi:general secretion pathway protein C
MFVGSSFLVAQGVNQVSEAALSPMADASGRAVVAETIEPRSWNDRKAILDRNLFDAQVAGGTPIIEEPEEVVEELVDTKLPLKLLGTIASQDQIIASASIENTRDRSHENVRVGDRLKGMSDVEVEKIGRGHVVLINGARREILKLSEEIAVPTRSRPPSRRTARSSRRSRSDRDPKDRLRDLAKSRGAAAIFSQARILPRYENGQMVGIQVSKIEAGSLFEEVGLQDGDTITAVNGEPLDNPAASKNLLDALRRGESIVGTVEDSSGQPRDIEITADKFLEEMDKLEEDEG